MRGLASTRVATGAVSDSRVAGEASDRCPAQIAVIAARASCAARSAWLAASIPATCCHAEAISAVRWACTTWVPIAAAARLRGSRLRSPGQPGCPGVTAGAAACHLP